MRGKPRGGSHSGESPDSQALSLHEGDAAAEETARAALGRIIYGIAAEAERIVKIATKPAD
jgi:hypothetical protein